MIYATAAEMRGRFQAERPDGDADLEIDCLAGAGDARLTAALEDASAEIDAALHDIFPSPLPAGPWPLLRPIACDLARLRLYDDEAPKRVLGAGSSARGRLRRLAAGETALVDAAGNRAPRRPLVQATAPRPVMTRDALADA